MEYRAKAKLKPEKLPDLYRVLTDGTVAKQKPDGAEIVAAMKNAKITGPGVIEWYETCYCEVPLKHERETVLDKFLAEIETERVEERTEIVGESFWMFLENAAEPGC
jgi:hypothetical protein